jgi:hypothetical protein
VLLEPGQDAVRGVARVDLRQVLGAEPEPGEPFDHDQAAPPGGDVRVGEIEVVHRPEQLRVIGVEDSTTGPGIEVDQQHALPGHHQAVAGVTVPGHARGQARDRCPDQHRLARPLVAVVLDGEDHVRGDLQHLDEGLDQVVVPIGRLSRGPHRHRWTRAGTEGA